MHNLYDGIKGGIGCTAAAFGVVTAPNDWLRIASGLAGIVVAGVTVWSIVSRNRTQKELARLRAIKDAQAICHVCRLDGTAPKECPYPLNDRPDGCIFKDYKLGKGKDPHHHKHIAPQRRD